MSNQVELSVKSQLGKIISDLEKITDSAKKVNDGFTSLGGEVENNLKQNTERARTYLEKMRSSGGRIAQQLKQDFKTLFSLNAIQESLKLSDQFKGTIKDTLTLSDTIRKLGRTFGIASDNFSSFQSRVTKGLGQIGMSSEVASRIMEGLADTNVRGETSLMGYSKTSGQLASVTKQQGREGDIAKGIAEVLTARGVDPNNMKAMGDVAEDLRRVFVQTGKGPTDTLGAMKELFSGMSQDFRKQLSTRALVNMAAAAQVSGPNSVKFLEEYLQKSPITRMAFDAQGGKGIIGKNGIDLEKFGKFATSIMSRVGGDPRLAAQTLGLSDQAAEGFIRLAASLDKVKAAQEGIKNATGNLDEQYKESMGFAESFRASINRVKSVFATPLAGVTQGLTSMLGNASQSNAGAGAVVAGGGILAALLAGYGARGLGKGMIGGFIGRELNSKAVEGITGEHVQKVEVVNFPGNFKMPGVPGVSGGAMTAMGATAARLGGPAAMLLTLGGDDAPEDSGRGQRATLKEAADRRRAIQQSEGSPLSNESLERNTAATRALTEAILGTKLNGMMGIKIETQNPNLKATTARSRGASF